MSNGVSLLIIEVVLAIGLIAGLTIALHLRSIKIALGKLQIILSGQYTWNPQVRADLLLIRPEEWLLKDAIEAFRDIYMPRLQRALPGNLTMVLDDLVIVLKPHLGIDYRYAILKPWFSKTKYLIQVDLRLFDPARTKEEVIARAIAHSVTHLYLEATTGKEDKAHENPVWGNIKL